ncbi:MAG: ATP-grasp domain-containing protein [Dongiaceae bacterium]
MAEAEVYLIVALSGRALALAVRRSGRCPVVLDLFGDADMRANAAASLIVAGDFDKGFDESALLAAAERLAPAGSLPPYGLAYGSGLESRPELLARLAEGRRLYGNTPETVARTKDPRRFFPLLDRLGIPYPEIAYAPPADPAGWLVKQIGGSGGGHVAAAGADAAPGEGSYFQRRMRGRSIGVSFLADGRRSFLLGCSEQWSSPSARPGTYRFGGLLQPTEISQHVLATIPAMLDALVDGFGLVGLNSLDLLVEGDDMHVLEVNPRPGANLDVFDGGDPAGLFGLHVAACEGRLPRQWTPPPATTAMSVLYADEPLLVPTEISWPDWVADRPAPGARIERGAPVCTVLVAASSCDAARELMVAREAFVRASLCPADDRPAPCRARGGAG